MGEILEVGTEAETCLMAGKGMNGLRGTVVCFNTNNQRYTLELDSGEMMSLRARNVKVYHVEPEEEEEEEEEEASFVEVDEKQAKTNDDAASTSSSEAKKNKPSTSQLPKYRYTDGYTEEEDQDHQKSRPTNKNRQGNIIDRFLYSVFGFILDASPSVILLMAVVAYWAHKVFFFSGGDGQEEQEGTTTDSGTKKDFSHSYNDWDHPYYYSRRSRWYHWHAPWHWGSFWYWGWYGMSGIFSVLVVSFFVWQFGTRKGRVAFRWRNVQDRVAMFDFWEAMRYFALLEGALLFFMRMAQPSPRRR